MLFSTKSPDGGGPEAKQHCRGGIMDQNPQAEVGGKFLAVVLIEGQ